METFFACNTQSLITAETRLCPCFFHVVVKVDKLVFHPGWQYAVANIKILTSKAIHCNFFFMNSVQYVFRNI